MKNVTRLLLAVVCAAVVGGGSAVAGPQYQGFGGFDFGPSFVPVVGANGEPGRLIVLNGAIVGNNFEPGICEPSTEPDFTNGKCLFFTQDEPVPAGYFKRAHPGGTAFTICDPCTVAGKTGSFVLKISYPNPKNLLFTKFTIQDAAGELEGLRGQGTLDFTDGSYTVKFHFVN